MITKQTKTGDRLLLDEDDAYLLNLYLGDVNDRGYALLPISIYVPIHRFVDIAKHHSPLPDGLVVHHINGNRLDNRRENLMRVDRHYNNRARLRNKNNDSGYRGVRRQQGNRKWQVALNVNGRVYFRSGFDTAEEAAMVYDALARKYHGEAAGLNFPDREPIEIPPAKTRNAHAYKGRAKLELHLRIRVETMKRNGTGFIGINRHLNGFVVRVPVIGGSLTAGRFPEAELAALGYDFAIRTLYPSYYAPLNFPEVTEYDAKIVDKIRPKLEKYLE